jgi:manganese transport protein
MDVSPETQVSRTTRVHSLSEVHGSIAIPRGSGFWRKALAFSGPGFLVAVGYMDPGNWATDLGAGSEFAYRLLFVILLSNIIAILLQTLAARLGIVAQQDLAQVCRERYSRRVGIALWIGAEIAIAACDLAEVIGSAIALNLLFHIPLLAGVCLTSFDVVAILYLQHRGFRYLEAVVLLLIGTIGLCYLVEIAIVRPDIGGIAHGLVPDPAIFTNRDMLYISIGILGATVMPHNLYLHSSLVQTRAIERTPQGIHTAIHYNFLDYFVALNFAFLINAAILIMAAGAFYTHGMIHLAEIQDAYHTLSPLLGAPVASLLFALALLCSGQNSTLTGTLAGQVVMEGFLRIRLAPWLRRLVTRLLAIVPAVIVVAFYGKHGTAQLLILSQVILSLQLPFAVFPLLSVTNDRRVMGKFASAGALKVLGWIVAILIAFCDLYYLLLLFL